MTQRLEEALFTQGGSSTAIRAHFKKSGPDHGVGFAALASSYLAEGNKEEARKYAVKAWRELNIPATLETGFLERFSGLLTAADHKARLDRLIIDDIRYSGPRNERTAYARRVIPLLPPKERTKAEARLAVFMKSNTGRAAIEALAPDNDDLGLRYHRAQVLRRAGNIEAAGKLMLSVPLADKDLINADEWWAERRALAYAALKSGKSKLTYDLVKVSGPLSANPMKEQTFMAGWVAQRYLKDTEAATGHFKDMLKAADGPLSRAKANYWLGRMSEAGKDTGAAKTFYTEAARDADTFHGQLAMQKLNPGQTTLDIKPPAAPSSEEIERFNGLDAAKAIAVGQQAKLDSNILRSFTAQLRFYLKTEAEMAMIAHLSESVGDTQMALRTAKAAVANRQNLLYYAYPVHPFPAYSPLRQPVETAFLLGVARQETEFNNQTVSGAGAKGLLQVMTITAQHVCRDYKLKCDIKRLLSDPAYNTMMASAYIADRMDNFRGSYVLTLAGYNAGPGRAREWISEFGDPRDPKIDPIDWIERIPIQETREYVAKVLANIQVYRARLGQSQTALQLGDDLLRARLAAGEAPPPPRTPANDDNEPGNSGNSDG
jgi:soluble lytic murein transglycosylase